MLNTYFLPFFLPFPTSLFLPIRKQTWFVFIHVPKPPFLQTSILKLTIFVLTLFQPASLYQELTAQSFPNQMFLENSISQKRLTKTCNLKMLETQRTLYILFFFFFWQHVEVPGARDGALTTAVTQAKAVTIQSS